MGLFSRVFSDTSVTSNSNNYSGRKNPPLPIEIYIIILIFLSSMSIVAWSLHSEPRTAPKPAPTKKEIRELEKQKLNLEIEALKSEIKKKSVNIN